VLIDAVRNARVVAGPGGGLVDVVIGDGRITAVVPAGAGPARGFDVEGRVVLPGLVDAHVHLDKAYQLDALAEAGASLGTLAQAIDATAAVHRRLTDTDRVAAAERLLARMVRHGTTAARVHVELSPSTGLDSLRWHLALADAWADRITLQLVAFPQHGLFSDPGVPALMEEALLAGAEVVGACPYADDDPARHIAHVVELAARSDRPLDLHIDFTGDPGVHDLDLVVDAVRPRRWGPGRVTAGHATSLAAMDPDDIDSRARELAALGIGVVSLPATDLFLVGSLAPLPALVEAGVTVALGTNNVANAFTPYGDGSLLQMAWLAGLVAGFQPGSGHTSLLAMVTSSPASLLGFGRYGVVAGAPADLVVLDTDRTEQAVSAPAEVVATCHRGRLTTGPADTSNTHSTPNLRSRWLVS
jgi:cytosine deaminase